VKTVTSVLNEETAKHGLVADVNVKLMDQSTPLHCAV
jgi:ankyrin repeat protein